MANYLETIDKLYEIERQRSGARNVNNYKVGAASVAPTSVAKNTEKKNKGSVLGGIGYAGEKLGAGIMQSIEGIWDFAAAGIADLVGADRWAERQIANDWFGDWYDTAGEWFNAGKGWSVAGDVMGGIGTSAISIGTAFIPVVGPWVAVATASLSGGGSGVREAYKQSGKLTGKEWTYGALTGGTEGVLEGATNLIGAGTGTFVKTFSKTASKNLAKGATKVAKNAVYEKVGKMIKGFAGEAFEEGMATFLSPYYARATYDPNAENATPQEIAYTALVGGLAGVAMAGAGAGVKALDARITGSRIFNNETEQSVINAADFMIEQDNANPSGSAYITELKDLRTQLNKHLESQNGAYDGKAKTLLGKINVVTVQAMGERALGASATHIAMNADQIAEALNTLNYTDGNGNAIRYTADELREGIEFKNGRPTTKSIRSALKNNVLLRELVTRDAAGHLLMDTDVFAEETARGRLVLNEKELGDFVYNASDAKKRELGSLLGIEDWNAVDVNQVNDRIAAFMGNGGDMYYARREEQINSFEMRRSSRKTRLDNASDYNRKRDGIGRYVIDGNDIAIEKNGDTYTIYDYDNKTISKELSESDLRAALSEYDGKRNATKTVKKEKIAPEADARRAQEQAEQRKSIIAEIDEYARKHIVGFGRLNPENKATVRRVIRQGRARGVKESVLIDYANVAARAKIDVVFDKEATARTYATEDGGTATFYVNAFYDPRGVRIVANPEAQTSDSILIHELDHALRKSIKGGMVTTKIYGNAVRAVDQDTYKEIMDKYTKGKKMSLGEKIEITKDEVNAYYAQIALGEKDIMKHLVAEKPTIKDKILSFFKKASGDYIGAPNLQKQAMRYYKQYRKWFNEFAKERTFAVMGDAVPTVDEGELRYSTDKTFSEQLEDVISGTHNPRYDLYVSETPEYLVGLNFPSGPVLMRNSKVNEILKKHEEMSEEILKGVPLALKDPILVLKSKTHPTESAVVVTDVMTSKGEMIVPVWVNQDGSYVDVDFGEVNEKTNFVASAYGRNIKSLLQYANENDGFFYQTEDEKRVKNLLARNGLQLPTPLRISNSTIIIPETAEKSNPSDENSSKKSSNFDVEYLAAVENGDMKTAQRMVDEAAKKAGYDSPKVYHGSSEKFTEFSYDKIGSSTGVSILGDGFYFTDEKKLGEGYGGRLYEAYLKLHNPYIAISDEAYKLNALELSKKGYDGVTLETPKGKIYMVFDNTQIKSADPVTYDDSGNVIPLSKRFDPQNPDIRYSLPLTDAKGNPIEYEDIINKGVPYAKSPDMTVGQMRKHIANTTHYKVFSKRQILEDVKKMPMGDLLKAETREQIADSIWQSFNTFKSAEQVDSYIHDMAKYILSASMREARVSRTASEESQRRFNSMRPYVQGLTFTDGELEDIRTARGDDGLKRLLGRWGYKARKDGKKHTTPMDVFVTDMAREVGEFGNLEDMNPVDAFLALDEAYEQAKTDVDDKWQSVYEDATNADLESLLQYIEADLRTAYEDLGDKTAFMKELAPKLKNAVERSEYWKAEYDKTSRYSRFARIVEEKAKELRDLRKHKFHNMTQAESDTLDASIGDLSKIMYKGVISVKMTRKACAELLLLYRSEAFKNKILLYENDSNPGLYNGAIENYLEILADGNTELLRSLNIFEGVDEEYRQSVNVKKGFSAHELKLLDGVLSYFVNFYKSYGKVYHRGTLVDIDPLAKKFIGIEHENAALKENVLLRSVAGKWFAEAFLDPMALMRMADGYAQDGFNTTMLEDLREAKIKATIAEMRIMKEYDEFLTKNEKYLRKSSESTVNVRGQEITKMKLIDLYCTTFRKQAWEGLAINGYQYNDTKGNLIRVDGELDAQQAYEEFEVEAAVVRLRNEIEQHLTEKDREYITLVEHIYNVESKRLKQERDVERFGFSNVEDGYYYPIRRANRRTNVDKVDIKEELDRVSNASFNKDIVKHARQELSVESADSRLRRHVAAVCQYAHMSATVEAFNRIFNYDIAGNPNRPISVKTETRNAWKQLEHYWIKLIGDAQGVHTKIEGDGIFSYIRGGYAIAMLSANPKVWLTQLSSFAAASGVIDASSIARGLNVATKADVENIGRYCPLAEIRRYENTAALAQGVLDKRGVQRSKGGRAMEATRKFGEWGMKPIGKTDEFVINRLFGACMVEVEKHGGAKIGTEANKIAAGKMLTKLILETQQNAMATERSAAMRSGNEFLRTATMFSSDAMKVAGRFFDAAGEVRVLKARAKATSDPEVKAQYDSKLKAAKKKLRKAIGALVVTAAYMAGIAALFKVLYNKWDKEWKEDEAKALTVAKSISVDFIGNMIGGLPLIRDVYTKLFEGYDVDNYAYSAINDVLNSASSFVNLLDKNATSEDVARALKSLVYSTSSFTGIPARNMYNVVFGITKRISEPAAYKIDEVFYKHNYKNDLGKYIEQGDTKMTDFMLDLLYDTETTGLTDSTMKSLRSLAELGYTVTPRDVADTITVDGEEYAIAPEEQSAIEEQYFSHLSALDRLTSSASYGRLTDEQRAAAAKAVHDMTYKKAVSDVMGTEASKSVLIASCAGVENLAVLNALVKGYEDDVSKTGDKVSGSKRKKIVAAINSMPLTLDQKILLMYAKGYTPKDGEIPGVSAESAKKRLLRSILNAKELTKPQKESLARACGFTVKNGKISL